MSLFSNLFGKEGSSQHTAWKLLESDAQLEQLIRDSYQKPVGIFKHSTRCGISSMAKHRLERAWRFTDDDLDFYYLDLLNYRSISNRIAEVTEIAHESPQVILLFRGKAVYHDSHSGIQVESLQDALSSLSAE